MSSGLADGPTPLIDLTPACAVSSALIAALDDAELRLPTPCAGYDVGGLMDHLHVVAQGDLDGLAAVWRDPAAWEGTADLGVEPPDATWGRIAPSEVVAHGWDLAEATGRPLAFDEGTLRGTPVTPPTDAPLLDRIVAATGRTATVASWRNS